MNQHPYTINIFLADGNPAGLRIITKTGWSGKGVVFFRNDLPRLKERDEFQLPGVYVLIGDNDEGSSMIYIGEGDPVKSRLESHYINKDFWTWCIFFCSSGGELNKAHIKYIESELIKIAKETKKSLLDNSQLAKQPNLNDIERATSSLFLREMFNIFPLVGLTVFEKPEKKHVGNAMFFLKGPLTDAQGYESSGSFIVLKGSKARKKVTTSSARLFTERLEQLSRDNVFNDNGDSYTLLQDYTFSSSSFAASLFLARSANGRIEWKTNEGITLKEFQNNQIM